MRHNATKQELSDIIASLLHLRKRLPSDTDNEALVARLKFDEGFRAKPYRDTEGKLTIGYGTLIEDGITMEEADWLLRHRLGKAREALLEGKHAPLVRSVLPQEAVDIIEEMCYQMGVEGVYGFRKMWAALERGDYHEAAKEMLDSLWASQTPNRAKRLASRMRDINA